VKVHKERKILKRNKFESRAPDLADPTKNENKQRGKKFFREFNEFEFPSDCIRKSTFRQIISQNQKVSEWRYLSSKNANSRNSSLNVTTSEKRSEEKINERLANLIMHETRVGGLVGE
jgi:hypothetical protein